MIKKIKKYSIYLMSAFYVFGGINHFLSPEMYLKIMPAYIPYHAFMVNLSGLIEIGLGLTLIYKPSRNYAVIHPVVAVARNRSRNLTRDG